MTTISISPFAFNSRDVFLFIKNVLKQYFMKHWLRGIETSGSALAGAHSLSTRRNATPVFLLSRSQIVFRLVLTEVPYSTAHL